MENKKIIVGVTGGIAAYKTCELVRLLAKGGFAVRAVMTESAIKLVGPATFEALSKNKVYIDQFAVGENGAAAHIDLVKWADAMVVAPATANTIGKYVNGIADNLLTVVMMALSDAKPLVIAPAMNANMWENVFVQKNMKRLTLRKNCHIAGPIEGMLADGTIGAGRMAEPQEIMEAVDRIVV